MDRIPISPRPTAKSHRFSQMPYILTAILVLALCEAIDRLVIRATGHSTWYWWQH